MPKSEQHEIQHLVKVFADSISKQKDAIRDGNPSLGNQHARKYIAAFDQLRALGDTSLDSLAPMLDHPREDVRAMAACFLLGHRRHKSLEVLRAAANSGNWPTSGGAVETLKRWAEGTWTLDGD